MSPLADDKLQTRRVPIAQSFRSVRFGGRKDIFFHAEDVILFIQRTSDVQGLHEAKQMLDSMRDVLESTWQQAIKEASAGSI